MEAVAGANAPDGTAAVAGANAPDGTEAVAGADAPKGAAAVGVADPAAETERRIARDIARHGLLVAPAVVAVAALARGGDGAASAGFSLGLVLCNFLFSAALLTWGGRISHGALAGAALGGYVLRLGLVTVAVLVVRNMAWVDMATLGATLVIAHLGLLVWELRSVSLTFAAPGLKSERITG